MTWRPGVASVKRLWQTLRFVWRAGPGWLVANTVLIVLQGVLPLLFLYTLKLVVDVVARTAASGAADRSDVREVLSLVGVAAGIVLAQSLCTAIGRFVTEGQAQAVTDVMYGVLHDKSVEVDLGYYEDPRHKNTLHRAQQQAPYRPGRIVHSLFELAHHGVALLAMAGLLTAYAWWVLPVLVGASVPGVWLRLRYSSAYYSWELHATERERLSAYLNQVLTTGRHASELRLFGLGRELRTRFLRLRDELRREKFAFTTRRSVAEFVGEGLAVLGVFGVLAHISYTAVLGGITVGSLIMYHGGLQRSWSALGAMLRSMAELYENSLFIKDLFDFLEVEPRVCSIPEAKVPAVDVPPALELEGVHFHYPHDERPVLRGIDLSIGSGEHVALVGHNGCGKTTLVKLLCRLYDPTEGVIRVGGDPLRSLDLAAHRARLGVLMQDYCRYQMTLRENVRIGDIGLDPRDARIDSAVVEAGAHFVADELADGVDTMLGTTFEGGSELSAGQWQKVALARMLVRNAKLLLLDEPTSSMDAEAEEQLISKLREVALGRTTILISHRLAAVKGLDRIAYLEHGAVAECGSHDELMQLRGGYAHLFELQSKHYR